MLQVFQEGNQGRQRVLIHFHLRVMQKVSYLVDMKVCMHIIATPLGTLEAISQTFIWNPIKGRECAFSVDEYIIELCPCQGPQDSITSVILFGKDGLYLRIAVPSMIPLQRYQLEQVPECSIVVYIEGQAALILAYDSEISIRLMTNPRTEIYSHAFTKKVKLLHREGEELLVIHGLDYSRFKIAEIIPLLSTELSMMDVE